MNKLVVKLQITGLSIKYALISYPSRLKRIILHFLQWMHVVQPYHLRSNNLLQWFTDLGFYVMDVLLLSDGLELVYNWVQRDVRRLNKEEMEYAERYFNDQIKTQYVKINSSVPVFIQKFASAFVGFNTIHYSKHLSKPVFVHELVHIWQFQRFGSVYIYRALLAQHSSEGYDYGGLENLYHQMLNSVSFSDFNFEQQGEIFEDYCRMVESEGVHPIAQASYEYFVGQVQSNSRLS